MTDDDTAGLAGQIQTAAQAHDEIPDDVRLTAREALHHIDAGCVSDETLGKLTLDALEEYDYDTQE